MRKKKLYYREYNKLNATVNALGVFAFDLAGAKLVKDSYNLISLIRNIMDIKSYEELGDVAHTYDLSNSTTANFKFVKEYGQPDSRQRLGFMSTKCFVRVDYQFEFFVFRNGKHDRRKIVQQYHKTVKPKLYDNDWAAIDHYLRPSSTPTTDFVRYIEFKGIRNRYLGTIYPVTPAGIAHIY